MNHYDEFSIQKYLSGRMDQEEQSAFEEYLGRHPRLSEEVKLIGGITQAVNDEGLYRFSLEVAKIGKALKSNESSERAGRRIISGFGRWMAAAGILLLIGISGWWAYRNSDSGKRLFKKYYHPAELPVTYRSGEESATGVISEGLAYFREGAYPEALEIFSKLISENDEDASLWLMLGESQLMSGLYPEAQKSFQKVVSLDSGQYRDEARWALGFSYLVDHRKNDAERVFKAIQVSGGFYSERAGDIVKKLN